MSEHLERVRPAFAGFVNINAGVGATPSPFLKRNSILTPSHDVLVQIVVEVVEVIEVIKNNLYEEKNCS